MENALVIELQRFALASTKSISELLRHAKAVAVKLDLDDARQWIDHELSGYPQAAELPEYRTIPSELRVKNLYHGWNAVAWGGGGNLQEHFAAAEIRQSIAEVETIAESEAEGEPHSTINQAEMDVLLGIDASFGRLPAARFFGRSSFIAIVGAVRAKILDWALALEKKGVRGDNMSFNDTEKREAAHVVLRIGAMSLTVLLLSANVDQASPLAVETEHNRITKVRNGSKHQSTVHIEALPDLDFPEFAKSLRMHAPTLVHFCGHGASNGALLMRDENGKPFLMQPDGLSSLLLLQKATIRLVVLNACYSMALADLLAAEIDCVIGMTDSVSDEAAVLFAQIFYAALFDGISVGVAFATGSAAIQARYPAEQQTPQLRVKPGVDASSVYLTT